MIASTPYPTICADQACTTAITEGVVDANGEILCSVHGEEFLADVVEGVEPAPVTCRVARLTARQLGDPTTCDRPASRMVMTIMGTEAACAEHYAEWEQISGIVQR